ncbi:MAG TPA: tRNA pseudouridine(55) synthase TruB, partial [Gemmataceae bacterium]|nr:tRNA pseudouridine(55) synthase TruB [Gemmataceae bacterium]
MAHEEVTDGFLILDKPLGISSRAAVDIVQKWFPKRPRIGHAGTLDPLASGVLVLAIGVATRLVEYVQAQTKVYRAVVTLGATTSTDDSEGEPQPIADAVAPERATVERVLGEFLGTIQQVPPAYSAAHVEGQRAYRLARRGECVELAPRAVRIDRIDIEDFAYPRLDIEIACGKGTYIRSLARDLGQRLGTGGYLSSLRRTRIGVFDEFDAIELDSPPVPLTLRSLNDAVAYLPRLVLDDAELCRLANGQRLP